VVAVREARREEVGRWLEVLAAVSTTVVGEAVVPRYDAEATDDALRGEQRADAASSTRDEERARLADQPDEEDERRGRAIWERTGH